MTKARRSHAPERYLWARGNIWWYRQSVPTRYREVAGVKIVQKSLRTSDRREASVRAAQLRAELHREWEERSKSGASPTRTTLTGRVGFSGVSSGCVRAAPLIEPAKPGQSLMDLFELYSAQRVAEGRKRADTVNQDRKVLLSFAAFVGAGRAVGSIKKEDVRNWRNAVAACPPNFGKMNAYSGLSLKDAAAKAKADGAAGPSATTVNKYMSTVSPFLSWCVREGYAASNPCDGLHFRLEKGRNRRPSFSDSQLEAIFSSPLFTGFHADAEEHLPGTLTTRDWRFWIPIISFFTGARIGEIAQLRVHDVRSEHGTWLIHIRHEPTAGQRTKSGKSRLMPVHTQLAALGFISFVKEQRDRAGKDGNFQLFPELTPNERDHMGGKPSRFWRDYLRRIGVKCGPDGLGSHSFRHTITDKLRAAGFLNDQIGILLGHSQHSTTSGYGALQQGTVEMLSAMAEKISFPIVIDRPQYDEYESRKYTS